MGVRLRGFNASRLARSLRWRTRYVGPALQLVRHELELALNGPDRRLRVYFPYRYGQLHNVWRTYCTAAPIHYSPYATAALCHWINWIPPEPKAFLALGEAGSSRARYIHVPGPVRPSVVEVEHVLALGGNIADWPAVLAAVPAINRAIARDDCRAVVTLSAGLVQHSRRYLAPELWPKLRHLYNAFAAQTVSPDPPDGPFTVLTIANRFYDKGVPEALRAFTHLRSRYGSEVRMLLVSRAVPTSYRLPEGVILHDPPLMSDAFKEAVYRQAHVLVIPCYSDTMGCFPEAYAFGVPVITTRIHHGDEYVRHGRSGFLLETPIHSYSEGYGTRWPTWTDFEADCQRLSETGGLRSVVDQLIGYLEGLFMSRGELARMRAEALAFHADCFSPAARNARLIAIYSEALGLSSPAPPPGGRLGEVRA